MPERIQRINIIVLTVVIIYTIIIQRILLEFTIITPNIDSIIALFSSIGFYRVLILFIYFLINNSQFLLKLFWGGQYLSGLWSYTYVKEGDPEGKRYFGVWRFEQDLFRTKVVGFGLNKSFEIRSRVRSVTDMIEDKGFFDIVNLRSDYIDPERNYYSKTSMTFDKNETGLLKYPVKIRSKTIIYGGELSGDVHKDVFIKHENAQNEDEVINALRSNIFSNIPATSN